VCSSLLTGSGTGCPHAHHYANALVPGLALQPTYERIAGIFFCLLTARTVISNAGGALTLMWRRPPASGDFFFQLGTRDGLFPEANNVRSLARLDTPEINHDPPMLSYYSPEHAVTTWCENGTAEPSTGLNCHCLPVSLTRYETSERLKYQSRRSSAQLAHNF